MAKTKTTAAATPITERVKSLEDLWAVSGKTPETFLPYPQASSAGDDDEVSDEQAINAFATARLIARVLNEGWKPNWKDSSERKWLPLFWMNSPTGFRFYVSTYVFARAYAGAGSGLRLKTEALSDHAAKYFPEVYENLQRK